MKNYISNLHPGILALLLMKGIALFWITISYLTNTL